MKIKILFNVAKKEKNLGRHLNKMYSRLTSSSKKAWKIDNTKVGKRTFRDNVDGYLRKLLRSVSYN